ncbi:unnamed protein product [Miscanthus lutarioriparius]|uniref:H(+)/Pi cotransporter n=1 Tax=Miscanthus lutarioriparius TaxID=422564 RepID=A0A811QY23_9POAL|nr:unnamed protein product [Miscanthus lutarioriparius]
MMFHRLQKAVTTSVDCQPGRARRQIRVLDALDAAKTQWYHFTAVVISGMGFFTDAYDLFCISLVTDLLGRIYYHNTASDDPGSLPKRAAAAVKGIALLGTMFGQLFFGVLGDNMGRKRIYSVTLVLMAVCSIASGLSFHHTPTTVVTTLCFFRFWLSFGIGGDYPLSATIMTEYANKKTRGAFMAAVFSMQGLGNLAAGVVVLTVSGSFMNTPTYTADMVGTADYVWRIVLMFGAIPALLTFYWRMRMPETARYTALVGRNLKQAVSDMNKTSWFGDAKKEGILEQTHKIAKIQALIAVSGTLPGYFFTIMCVDSIGRIAIQLMGFTIMTIFILVLAAMNFSKKAGSHLPIGFTAVVYGCIFFFANFGPNSTTFIVPTEIFPTRLRSTCHGIAGAGGKAGAIVGVMLFLYAGNSIPLKLLMLAGCNLVGIVFTVFLPESKRMSLEDITGEIQEEMEHEPEQC